jgi:hypothetical protein
MYQSSRPTHSHSTSPQQRMCMRHQLNKSWRLRSQCVAQCTQLSLSSGPGGPGLFETQFLIAASQRPRFTVQRAPIARLYQRSNLYTAHVSRLAFLSVLAHPLVRRAPGSPTLPCHTRVLRQVCPGANPALEVWAAEPKPSLQVHSGLYHHVLYAWQASIFSGLGALALVAAVAVHDERGTLSGVLKHQQPAASSKRSTRTLLLCRAPCFTARGPCAFCKPKQQVGLCVAAVLVSCRLVARQLCDLQALVTPDPPASDMRFTGSPYRSRSGWYMTVSPLKSGRKCCPLNGYGGVLTVSERACINPSGQGCGLFGWGTKTTQNR